MKEMVGGCCVCSDEHGWTENPLVYCDGQNCTVAVHQACYGIVTVPTGPWYCRKCESQERSARVRCELCPSRDGALKKTDNQGWAHVVCALYIPEVRFGNVTTMEPIILQLIPPERFAKTCYICTENSKPSRATAGACMQCNKSGCKQQFHVTCAQALGLLCEEAGNYLDNVKYCGYCQHHYSKLVRKKKGGNVKTIPPYKPITHETGSSDSPSSPEKETNSNQNISTIPSGSSSTSNTIKITQSSTSSSTVSIMPVLPPASSSSSSSSSSKQRKSSSASKNSSSSVINNMPSGSSAALGGNSANQTSSTSGSGGSSGSKSSSGSTKDKDKHSKSVSSSKSSSKNDKNDLSSSSTGNLPNSSSSTRDKRDSKSSKSSSSNSSSSNNKDDSLNINTSSSNKISSSSTQQGSILTSSSSHKESMSSNKLIILPATIGPSAQIEPILSNASQMQDPAQIYAPANINSSSSSNSVTNDNNSGISNNKAGSSTHNITSGSSGGNTSNSGSASVAKKRKAESSSSTSSTSSKSTTIDDLNKDLIKDVSVTIIPITNIEKLDSTEFDKNSKKSKTSDSSTSSLSSSSLQIINEPNLQNVSPNQNINPQQPIVQLPPPQSQQPTLKPSSLNSSVLQSQSIIKPLVLKDVNDSRLHSTGQTTISPFSGAGSQLPQAPILPIVQQQSSQSQQQQQSLVVSVPLSNAGVNIPSNNTIQTNNNQAIHQGSGLYQHMTQTRDQLSASSGSRASPIVNYQQNHQTSTLPSTLGRKSPLIQGAALSPSPHLNELNLHNQPLQSQQQQQNISVLQNISPSLVNTSGAGSVNSSNPNNTSNSGNSIMSSASSAIATTSDTGMLKITYEKQPNSRIAQIQDDLPARRSRTPDTNYTTISYGGGLKFTYEAQPNSGSTGTPTTQSSSLPTAAPVTIPPISVTPQPIKDSPPSSPGSEAGSRKRTRKSTDSKSDVKIFQNGVVATHMLGNQINPASSVAQKMTDQLNMEIEAHSIYTSTSLDSGPQLVGPPYPGKSQSNSRSSSTQPGGLGSILSGSSSSSQSGNSHQSLEQLLERQWEQGSQFLMEQAQHFDIASLLSCLHQLRTENIRLEDHVNNLVARRDHLLAVNARLAIPLNPPVAPQAQGSYNNMHINGPTDIPPNLSSSRSNRATSSSQSSQQPHPQSHFNAQQSQIIENGVDFRGHGVVTAPGHQIPTNASSRHSSMSYTSTQHNSSSSRQQQSAISMNIEQQQPTSRNRTFQQTNYSTAHQPQLRPDDSQVKPS